MIKDITVYLADDHTLFRKGMIRLLQSFDFISHIEEAENGEKLIDLVEKKAPDVVLLDIRMPVMDGFDTCSCLKRNFPEVKVVILSMEDGQDTIIDLVERGATGYLSKAAEQEELALAIETVLKKDYFINEYLTLERIGLAKTASPQPQNNDSELTQRELEILSLTCDALSMKQIAEKLFIGERTVQSHRRNMMQKLNIKNANGLVAYALTNRIFTRLSPKQYPKLG